MSYGLIDLDGVLLDTEPLHERALRQTALQFGIPAERLDLASFKGIPDAVGALELAAICDPPGDPNAILLQRQANYAVLIDEAELFDGVEALLQTLKDRGYRLALATSALRINQQRIFERFGLGPFFDQVITAEDITQGKPHPEPYLKAAASLGTSPAEAFALEDSLAGIQSAKAAGCLAIGITHTFSAEALLAAGADVIVPSLTALARMHGVLA
ncbi:hypothetical protein AYO41_02330 [Verrucomicrobia bacterium SCGC AG-212-E04]|nr:hypothetical protein AYO41_02330 [Verrucomicrobia bacterium SCGC AG-212-E04]